MATTAAIYARLSVDRDGTKVGIDTQLEDSRRLARERGWNVVDEYIDRNLTAADRLVTRPEYERLVDDFASGRYSALICWDLDRLTRQPRQLEDWIDAADDKNFVIVTANGEADLGTDAGRLFARIKASVAKSEAERASARQKRNKQHRRENGQFHGGQAPFGYRVVDKTLIPAPAEVELIHEAARRLLEAREPLHSIVVDWNSPGKPGGTDPKHTTRSGKHWRQSNLRAILRNRSLLGETKAGVVGWEPVIDQRTFDRLQALFDDPARKVTHSPGVKGGKYSMGGGLSVCGRCGKPLITHTKSRDGQKQPSLSCLSRVNGPDPSHPKVLRRRGSVERWEDSGRLSIDHGHLETYVFARVIARLENTARWHERMGEQDPEVNARIDALESERTALRDQRERAGKAFVLGVMSERDAQREVERVDGELTRIDARIDELLRRPALAAALKNGLDWQTWTPGQRRAFLRLVIDRVVVNDWPEGVSRSVLRLRNETPDAHAHRQHDYFQSVLAQRVQIEWLA